MTTHNDSWEARIYDKYEDKTDERFGWAKHNNRMLQDILDDFREILRTEIAAAESRKVAEIISDVRDFLADSKSETEAEAFRELLSLLQAANETEV